MMRGINKRIVEIKNTDNDYFERAILFLRDGETKSEGEIKFLSGEYLKYLTDGRKSRKGIKAALFSAVFFFGFILGCLLIYIIK